MDASGRLVIPRDVRREAGLEPGVPLRIRSREGVIEIEPEPLPVTLVRRGRLLVASPSTKVPRLRAATVERTRDSVRGADAARKRRR
jgi:bifunctional DNA-binding transcriptional regulator/antitoxin component of YhaV-PrlF toxin-antitoxin module